MSDRDEDKQNRERNGPVDDGLPEAPAREAAATDEAQGDLAAENAGLKDKLLRALAETENVRHRAERERNEAAQYGLAGFARDVLAVADNLRRALDHLPAETLSQADEGLRGFVEGVEMTERELLNVLERHNIRAIHPKGERFDPHFHQAMFEVEHGDAPPGTVVEVIQTGYAVGDRLLRPAMVGVAKAPSAAPGDGGRRVDTSA
jgi:molecular chaperone GrpE